MTPRRRERRVEAPAPVKKAPAPKLEVKKEPAPAPKPEVKKALVEKPVVEKIKTVKKDTRMK